MKNETDLYINVHGKKKLKNLNKELERTVELLKEIHHLEGKVTLEPKKTTVFKGLTFKGKPVSKAEYVQAYEEYVSRFDEEGIEDLWN